ncbi:hypothetical protein MSPP1_000650 [Malassezia sp. CBS 17886]|nr:hypothetical protein MSPP1_000650 [Malassezia sp. CBS 17886]
MDTASATGVTLRTPRTPHTPLLYERGTAPWDEADDSSGSSDESDEMVTPWRPPRVPSMLLLYASPVWWTQSPPEPRLMRGLLSLDRDGWGAIAGNIFWGYRRQAGRRARSRALDYGALRTAPQPAHMPSPTRVTSDPARGLLRNKRSTSLQHIGFRTARWGEDAVDAHAGESASPARGHRSVLESAFRPTSAAIENVLGSRLRRSLALVVLPAVLVLVWSGMPFPRRGPGHALCGADGGACDAQFWFFLLWYYGCYVAVALIYITQLFTLYRLNWWPAALGARTSYACFWGCSLACGYVLHRCSPFAKGTERGAHWGRKAEWMLLAFATMAMPACICLAGLRYSGRQRYRRALTDAQKPFATEHRWRIPASYRRFLWFMGAMSLTLLTMLAGQGYATVYMSTLPHSGIGGTLYVAFWMLTVQVLSAATQTILVEKVRSSALQLVFRLYYYMVYYIFYRNLFARLRSSDQFALVQLLSSAWVCVWYPVSMSAWWHRLEQRFVSRPLSWDEYVEKVSVFFYLRNLAQHITMLAFIGWISLLHLGVNEPLYPFFAFRDTDCVYSYRLTLLGSLAIWASEILSMWAAAGLCALLYNVDLVRLGLAEMHAFPELLPTCVWTSLHVLMNMLFFMIRLDFS